MLRILVVEDHAMVREGLVPLLMTLDEKVVVHEAVDCSGALQHLAGDPDCDLVLLDLGLPGVSGLSCLPVMRERFPAVPVIVLSAFDDALTVQKVIEEGASGFVPKASGSNLLLSAVKLVLNGGIFLPARTPGEISPVVRPGEEHQVRGRNGLVSHFGLTERQADVAELMANGCSNHDIGRQLGLAEGTVKIHVSAILRALSVKNRTQAVLALKRDGWVA